MNESKVIAEVRDQMVGIGQDIDFVGLVGDQDGLGGTEGWLERVTDLVKAVELDACYVVAAVQGLKFHTVRSIYAAHVAQLTQEARRAAA